MVDLYTTSLESKYVQWRTGTLPPQLTRHLVRVISLIGLVLSTGGVGKDGNSSLESLHASRLERGRGLLELLRRLVAQLVGQGHTGVLALDQISLNKT